MASKRELVLTALHWRLPTLAAPASGHMMTERPGNPPIPD